MCACVCVNGSRLYPSRYWPEWADRAALSCRAQNATFSTSCTAIVSARPLGPFARIREIDAEWNRFSWCWWTLCAVWLVFWWLTVGSNTPARRTAICLRQAARIVYGRQDSALLCTAHGRLRTVCGARLTQIISNYVCTHMHFATKLRQFVRVFSCGWFVGGIFYFWSRLFLLFVRASVHHSFRAGI